MVDVIVTNHETLFKFRPISKRAKDWFENFKNQWFTWDEGSLMVPPNFADVLMDEIRYNNLKIA